MFRKQPEWLPAVVDGNGIRNDSDLLVRSGRRNSLIPSLIPLALGAIVAFQADTSGTLGVGTALIGYGLASVRHMLPKARDVVLVTHACNNWLRNGTYEVKGSGLKVSMADPELRVIGKATAYFDRQAGYILRVVLYCVWKEQVHEVMLTFEPVKGAHPLSDVDALVVNQVPDDYSVVIFGSHAEVLQEAIRQNLDQAAEAAEAAGQGVDPAGASSVPA